MTTALICKKPRFSKELVYKIYSILDQRLIALIITVRTEQCGTGTKTRTKIEYKNNYSKSKLMFEYRTFASDAKYGQLCQSLALPFCIESRE